ncbi:MAG TPA: hypothetical protein DCY48_04325 [Candidatus Magasanikbacteria bacterium]|nr:hypothetical protein [Candidatus Magasanikbacteria bacterium]
MKKGGFMCGKYYYTYIMTNRRKTVLYIGVTNNLKRRFSEHVRKQKKHSFTAKYNIDILIYFEKYFSPEEATAREKQLKGWTRKKKIDLVEKMNPQMKNLFSVLSETGSYLKQDPSTRPPIGGLAQDKKHRRPRWYDRA